MSRTAHEMSRAMQEHRNEVNELKRECHMYIDEIVAKTKIPQGRVYQHLANKYTNGHDFHFSNIQDERKLAEVRKFLLDWRASGVMLPPLTGRQKRRHHYDTKTGLYKKREVTERTERTLLQIAWYRHKRWWSRLRERFTNTQ